MNANPPYSRSFRSPVAFTPPGRSKFQGVVQVVQFNWPNYLLASAMVVGGYSTKAWLPLPPSVKLPVEVATFVGAFWIIASLVVSHWVYDRSDLHTWKWLKNALPIPPERWAILHAGFDESTTSLKAILQGSIGTVWDFYDPAVMTEPSINRARRLYPQPAGTVAVRYDSLPSPDKALDCAFLVFAAHELRSAAVRECFFGELYRVLKPRGHVLLVEHLQDAANLAAFGPGFLHFMPRSEWCRVATYAGFKLETEFPITSFVRIFSFRRPS